MDQPPAVAFTAFADAWPRAIETEIGGALCAIGRGKDFDFDLCITASSGVAPWEGHLSHFFPGLIH